MPELMLKPGWPGTFRRTVRVKGKEPRTIEFGANVPVEVSKEEMDLLAPDIGDSENLGRPIWPIERDDKKRPRYVEPLPAPKKAEKSEKTETKPAVQTASPAVKPADKR